jgi:hypothetical protein
MRRIVYDSGDEELRVPVPIVTSLLARIRASGRVRADRMDRLTRRVAELEAALARSRARARTDRAAWDEQRAKWERELSELRHSSAFFRRRVLDPNIVHELLPGGRRRFLRAPPMRTRPSSTRG